jgi:nicotinamide mononucleotide transporter
MPEHFKYILLEMQDIETIGVFFGIISVILTIKEKIWCWFFGIINVLLFAYVFFQNKIYGQTVLQIFFLALNVYGWYEWLYGGKDNTRITITRVTKKEILYLIPLNLFIVFLLNEAIQSVSGKEKFTILDSVITSLSFTAQFFLAKKILESWLVWIMVNILSISLFIQTGLYKIGFFYFILLILATSGYITWKRKLVN